jgi:hypothetical protein
MNIDNNYSKIILKDSESCDSTIINNTNTSPSTAFIKRDCSVHFEDVVTCSHAKKHIENENINIKKLKKMNYQLSNDVTNSQRQYFDFLNDDDFDLYMANPIEFLCLLGDDYYNKYIINWNTKNDIKLMSLGRKFTGTYINNLIIKENNKTCK